MLPTESSLAKRWMRAEQLRDAMRAPRQARALEPRELQVARPLPIGLAREPRPYLRLDRSASACSTSFAALPGSSPWQLLPSVIV